MHRKQIRRWHKLLSASAAIVSFLSALVIAPASATSAPTVDMFWADVSRTNQTSVTFYLMTNVTVKNIEASDFTVIGSATGCTIDDNFSPSSFFVISLRNCSDGSVAVQLGANSISDLSLNWGPASGVVSDFVLIDTTAPTFTFESTPATVSDSSFSLTASVSESVTLVDQLMRPTITGEGCTLAGINVIAQTFVFAIGACAANAEMQATIYANSYRDATGNLGPAQNVTSGVVSVQLAGAVVAEPLPTSTPTPQPTVTPEMSPTPVPTPTAEPTVLAVAPLEPPAPPATPEQPSEPQVELSAEVEPIVPWVPIKRYLAVPQPVLQSEPLAGASAPLAVQVAGEAFTPAAPTQLPEARIVESAPPLVDNQSPRSNFDWLALSLSVLATGLAAVGGVLFIRTRLARAPRLRMA